MKTHTHTTQTHAHAYAQKRILLTSNDLDSPKLKDTFKRLISATKDVKEAKMAYIPTAAMNMFDAGV